MSDEPNDTSKDSANHDSHNHDYRYQKNWAKRYRRKGRGNRNDGGIGCFMFLAFIGAAVYFVSKAHGFWDGVLGILKATVWPAFLVYQVLHGYNV